QTIGRAARNLNGRVIMYSDQMTDSMRAALDETNRRREAQRAYNLEHHITPASVKKSILDLSAFQYDADRMELILAAEPQADELTPGEIKKLIGEYGREMKKAADDMEFEQAADWRDRIVLLKEMDLGLKPRLRSALAAPQKREDKPRIHKGPPARVRRRR
ncbi:MAG: UvrB/UvrC motif-containing protein, partial [Myxococcaceae bacterium]